MHTIEKAFCSHFKRWGIRLPAASVSARARGRITQSGWIISYLFGRDERGEFLDYYARHRMTNDRHIRIYDDGHIDRLPSIQELCLSSDDAEEAKRFEARYLEENRKVLQLLERKGFS